MNKKTLFCVLLGLLIIPVIASAQEAISITVIATNIVNAVWIVATAIVIILWIATGVLFLVAQGDPGKLKTAKTALFTSIAGTVVIVLAYSARTIINNLIFFGA